MAKPVTPANERKTWIQKLEGWSYPRLITLTAVTGIISLIPDVPGFLLDELFFGPPALFFGRVLIGKFIKGTPTETSKKKEEEKDGS